MGLELISITSTRTSGASLLLVPSASTLWRRVARGVGAVDWDSEAVRPARFNPSVSDYRSTDLELSDWCYSCPRDFSFLLNAVCILNRF